MYRGLSVRQAQLHLTHPILYRVTGFAEGLPIQCSDQTAGLPGDCPSLVWTLVYYRTLAVRQALVKQVKAGPFCGWLFEAELSFV
jgi:hypothetical protein